MLPKPVGQIVRVKNAELNRSLFGSDSMETDPWGVKQVENMPVDACPPARKARGERELTCPLSADRKPSWLIRGRISSGSGSCIFGKERNNQS
jgi:hypothetical protein